MNYLCAVDYCFVDAPGGMARVAWDVASLVRGQGHQVAMICMNLKRTGAPPCSTHDGIRVVRYEAPKMPQWHPRRHARLITAAADSVRRELGGTRWDVVHMHAPFTGQAAMDALGVGPRYVYTMHSPIVLEQRINWRRQGLVGWLKLLLGQGQLRKLEHHLLKECSAIQTLSEYTRREVDRFYGMGSQVHVIPHWRRPELARTRTKKQAREQLGWPLEEPILFTVRYHGPRNGIDIGIRAVAPAAVRKRCVFMIGGDGPLRHQHEGLVRSLGASDQIRFLGRMSEGDLNLAYQAADLFLLPTRALECFGLIILEAFAFGCPVLCSNAGAIPEAVQPIMPDFIVPAGNVDALRDKVEAFLQKTLLPPSTDQLVAYLTRRYDASVVVPRIMELIVPQDGSEGGSHDNNESR